jgi:hypothetical protein
MPNITNPEAFQLEAATVLAAAYSAFPITFVWTHDPDSEVYPTETGQSRKDIQFQTIRWLIDRDYLYDEFGFVGGEWRGLGLTERGLTVLNSVPDALSGKEPLGKRLSVAVGKGGIDTIKQLIPAIIQQAFLGG